MSSSSSRKGDAFTIDRDVSDFVKTYKANGKELCFMPWAQSLRLAGRPSMKLVEFDGPGGTKLPFREIFGGAAVAVEIAGQRVYLPVQNASFAAMAAGEVDARNLSDTQARCRAKAIAMVTGVGLSIYADFKGDGAAFAKAVGAGITHETDLGLIPPLVSGKKRGKSESSDTTDFLGWPAAIAAANLADPAFGWSIEEWDVLDTATGEVTAQPYMRYGTGWAVGVTVTYRGHEHTEILPIMGMAEVDTANGKKKMDNQPLVNPDVNDWNKAVMRCLAKAIAVETGYGLSIYAKMDFVEEDGSEQEPAAARGTVTPITQKASSVTAAQPAASGAVQSREEAIREIEELLKSTGADRAGMLAWIEVSSLDDATDTALVQVVKVLRGKAARGEKAA
ncbi:DUF1071 domain-containing protein [Rhodanobacter sp. 115]|uniref:Sak single strand annealing protein n=1 Tax=Rhodanobacter sp. FW021-MT20 TaxID=1162282 RepID=UPI0034E51795